MLLSRKSGPFTRQVAIQPPNTDTNTDTNKYTDAKQIQMLSQKKWISMGPNDPQMNEIHSISVGGKIK